MYHWYDITYAFDVYLPGSGNGTYTVNPGTTEYLLLANSTLIPKQQRYYLQILTQSGTGSGSVVALITEITITESVTNVTCFGSSDGAIDITVDLTGGITPLTYSWSNGATTQDIIGLVAGDYTVTVTEGGGCTLSKTITVASPAPNSVTLLGKTDVSCYGGNDGSITVIGAGGTSPYSYSWSTGATSSNVTGLSAGNYCVTVTDAQSCTATACYDISEPPVFNANAIVISAVSCTGCSDGSVTVNVSGGVMPYFYYWLPGGQTNQTLNGLSAGTYSVTATDANGCTKTSSTTVTVRTTIFVNPDPVCDGYPFELHPDGCPGWDQDTILWYHWYDPAYVFDETLLGNYYFPSATGIDTMLVGSTGYNLLVNSPLTPKQCDYYLDITYIENGKMENGFGVIQAVLSSLMTNNNLQNVMIYSGQNTCFDATQSITVAGSGSTFKVENGGHASLVAGQDILFYPGTTVLSGGYLNGKITQTGQYCCVTIPGPIMGNMNTEGDIALNTDLPAISQQSSAFKIYPNPTTGIFTLECSGILKDQLIQVEVYTMRGEKILTEQFYGAQKHEFSLSDKPVGIYFIRVITGDRVETGKIVKQ